MSRATPKTKTQPVPAKTKRPTRLNFSAHVEDKDALAEVAEALGYMVQRGVNTGLRGSAEGVINAIVRGEVAVVKIVPQDDGPIPFHLEQYRIALGIAEKLARRAAKRARARAKDTAA